MLSVYLFAVLVGGGLLTFSLLGGHDSHGGEGGDHDGFKENPFDFLSIRTLTYFLFVFGGVGAILTWSWHAAAAPIVLLLSVVSGLGVGTLVSAAFKYLRQTDSGALDSEDSFQGLTGRITLPFGSGGLGKVLIRRGDRSYELLARPFDARDGAAASWKAVVVVEMQRGTALVMPLDDPALQASTDVTSAGEIQ